MAENEKKGIIEWVKGHPKTVFFFRVALWAIFSAILPFAFIAWRYQIFTSTSKIQLTGWGFVAVVIIVSFVSTLAKYIYKGLKPGFLKQCLSGFVTKIIPLVLLLLLICSIENNIKMFKQALSCVIICESIGVLLNPFPSWLAKRAEENKIANAETMSDVFWDRFFNKKGKGE